MAPAGILSSFLAAIQASLSVLLVIFYGGIAAHLKLLDAASAKKISQICVKMFLPALLLTQIGAELRLESAHRYLVIFIYALICHLISFLMGVGAHYLLGMPDWVTAALMFNNTTSYPLLLIQSLDETGILTSLIVTDESTSAAISRAKSYFLVFATVSSCLTFAVGPRLIDSEHSPDPESKDESENGDDHSDGETACSDCEAEAPVDEASHLLDYRRRSSVAPTSFFPSKSAHLQIPTVPYDRRPTVIASKRWNKLGDSTRWWLLFAYDFLNGPLIGAVLGTIIGLVPALQRAFFNETSDGGIFSAWLTPSLKNIGSIFVPMPVIVAGVSLYLSMKSAKKDGEVGTPWLTTIFILFVRFVLWSVISIGAIYLLAKNTDVLGDDPMLWFTMMLMPTGPSAMKLIAMVEVAGGKEEDEHRIAKLLTVSESPAFRFISKEIAANICLDILCNLPNSSFYSCGKSACQPGCYLKVIQT